MARWYCRKHDTWGNIDWDTDNIRQDKDFDCDMVIYANGNLIEGR